MLMHCTYSDCTDAYFTPLTKLKTALNPVLAIQINLELAGGARYKINSAENCFL